MTTTDTRRPALTRVDRLRDGILLIIVLLTGAMAGAASFHHVHDFTITNSPAGTADWFGWANAVISELIPTASLIEIGRRRRHHPQASVRYPMGLLVAAVAVSLTAQLAVAKPGVFGWMVSALPALAFFALSKLVFTATAPPRPTHPVPALTPATSPAPSPDIPRAQVRPAAAATKTRATAAKKTAPAKKTPARRTPATKTTTPATAEPVPAVPAPASAPAPAEPVERFPAPLLANARTIAVSHRDTHGEDIKANQLAVRLRVPTPIAADILTQLTDNPPTAANTKPHNGSTVEVSA
ncbi:hypothetical protein [Couchioplanes caeruleus]|uniref:DUF2637 domain-containing protein n=2 Tax=Couchioplanes caeruleus TaxID=56438 RepID=A0A1K0FZ97_9ACTN|nr:hypothetical protein BG844_32175 [Couchioplanes caeruleus subsp. caeruleus]ROP29780.1 hypothetical protein EDD30_2595 [Couchioplanes caeruleus]